MWFLKPKWGLGSRGIHRKWFRRGTKQRKPLFWAIGAFLIVVSLLSYRQRQARDDVVSKEMARLQAHARIVSDTLERQFVGVNNSLMSAAEEFHPPFANRIAPEASRHLRALVNAMPGVQALQIVDATGHTIASNREELIGSDSSQLEFFTTAQAGLNAAILYVSQPFKTVSDTYSINLSRVVLSGDGQFDGIVSATIEPKFFEGLMRSVLFSPDSSNGLAHYDGTLFLNAPTNVRSLGMNLARPGSIFTEHRKSGEIETTAVDFVVAVNEVRIIVARDIASRAINFDKPLNFAINRSYSAVLADWRYQTILISVLYLISAAAVGAGLLAYQRHRSTVDANEAFLRSIADNLPVSISYFDKNEICRFANATNANWAKKPVSEILGSKLSDYLKSDFINVAAVERTLAGAKTHDESYVVFPDGIARWVEISRIPDVGQDGNIQGYFRLMIDITERKMNEIMLAEMEGLRKSVLDSVFGNIAVLDGAGTIIDVNRGWSEFAQKNGSKLLAEKSIGMNYFSGILRDREYSGDSYAKDAETGIRLVLNGEIESFALEYPCDSPTEKRWFRMTASPLSGSAKGAVVAHQDITDRKIAELKLRESEKFLESVTDHLPVAISYFDTENKFRFVNRTAEIWYNKPRSEMIGIPFEKVSDPTTKNRQRNGVLQTLSGQKNHFESHVQYPDGTMRWIAVDRVPDIRENGEVVGYFRLSMDITERKEVEEKLLQAQRMEAVGQLTGGVAHDFNNLLAVIMGNLQLLERRGLNDATRKHLLVPALRATKRGAELTRQLLAFGRRQVLRAVPTRLDELLPNLRDMLGRTLGETIKCEWNFGDNLAPCLVDQSQLEAAILNLAINARDAMLEGGTIFVGVYNMVVDRDFIAVNPEVAEGKYVAVSVTDKGHGMAPEVLAKVFEPFYTTKDVGKGSGLGLSMVYGFVKQSGGHVTINSAPGIGTTVTLYLPQVAAESRPLTTEQSAESSIEKFSGTVLIVEDQEDVRATAVAQLEDLGFTVLDADSGAEALSALLTHTGPIDLLFSDVVLGNNMNGPDLVEEARRLNPNIKVIYVSGYAESMRGGGRSLELDAYLLDKPYSQEQLVEALKEVLHVVS